MRKSQLIFRIRRRHTDIIGRNIETKHDDVGIAVDLLKTTDQEQGKG